jgi:hypothetical protein
MIRLRRRILAAVGLAMFLGGCTPPPVSAVCATSVTLTRNFTMAIGNDLDVVFVIDDGPAMAGWQATLPAQLASLVTAATCPNRKPPPSLRVGVVSSDMGVGAAPNAAIPGCSADGDGGALRTQPEGMCTDSTLDPSATFISLKGDTRNFSASDDATELGAAKVFQCIAELGDGGCGFGQPLAALDRALGADGQPPPAANAGFLRPDAYLLIVFISNEDDCSAPAGSTVFSTSDQGQGPLTHYRCNHAGHLCTDPNGAIVAPPIDPPSDAVSVDGVRTLPLTNCSSNDTDGTLTPISKFVADIRALKPDPEQILVAGLIGPPSPYVVQWIADATTASGLRAEVAASCGSEAADGSGAFGEPSVRLSQFIEAFPNGLIGSVCDAHYEEVLGSLCESDDDYSPPCLTADLQTKTDAAGNTYPDCSVTEHLNVGGTVQDIGLPACATVSAGTPCWSIGSAGTGSCPAAEGPFSVTNDSVGPDPHYSSSVSVSCQLPQPSVSTDAGACSE